MRTIPPFLLLAGTLTFAFTFEGRANVRGFVHATDAELSGAADLNGNGLLDVVLADRENGQLRFAQRAGDGTLTWVTGSPTGLPSLDGLALGPIHSGQFDSFAVSSTMGNRLVRGAAHTSLFAPVLTKAHVSGVGPGSIAAVPVGGSETPEEIFDLFVSSERNATTAEPDPFLFQTVANDLNATILSTLFSRSSDRIRFDQANRVIVSDDPNSWPPLLAVKEGSLGRVDRPFLLETDETEFGGEAVIRFYPTADGWYDSVFHLQVASSSRYAIGRFGSVPGSTLLVGDSAAPFLFAYVLNTADPEIDVMEIQDLELPAPSKQIVVLEEGEPGRFLVIFEEDAGAAVFTYVPGEDFDLQEQFAAGEGRELTGAIADGNGGVTLLEGSGGGRSTHFAVYAWDGANFSRIQSGALSAFGSEATPEAANIFLFAREPLVHSNAGPIAFYRAGDWTVNAQFQNGNLDVETRAFIDAETGLFEPGMETISSVPSGANFVLTNQLLGPDQSLYSLDAAGGERIYSVSFDPNGGNFDRVVTLELSTSLGENSSLFYDLGGRRWQEYEPSSPPRLFRSATVAAFAREPDGTSTPIVSREFVIEVDDPNRDSDRDGVPDFVELFYGLDPKLSGPDSDGDGFTDLQEILAGSDPTNPMSVPGSETIDPAAAWDALLVLRGYDPGAYPAGDLVNAREGSRTSLYRFDGRLHGRAGVGGDGVARVADVAIDPRLPLNVGASAPRFGLAGFGAEDDSGHEVVGLVLEPELEAPRLPDFSFQGLTLYEEVMRWREEMGTFLAERGRTESQEVLRPLDTLVFALFERFVGAELATRNQLASKRANLAPFRLFGTDRERVTLEMLRGLSRPADSGEAFLLPQVAQNLKAAVHDLENSQLDELRELTREIYHLASDGPPLPLEALRQFIETGGLPTPYASGAGLSDSDLAAAHTAVNGLLGDQTARQRQILTLEVTATSFDGPCVLLHDPPFARDVALVDANGNPFSFARGIKLVPGSRVTVDGYPVSDGAAACSGPGIEVVSAVIDFMATPSPDDQDGNLLSDSWEEYFFGATGVDPFGDASGNGYTNLQHMLEGIDPAYAGPLSGVERLPDGPPRMDIDQHDAGVLRLEWVWPDEYAGDISFEIRRTSDLVDFDLAAVEPEYLGEGRYRVEIDPGAHGDAAFFRAFLSLR